MINNAVNITILSIFVSFGLVFLNIYIVNQYEHVYKHTQTLLQLKYLEKISESKLESYKIIRDKNIELEHLIHDAKKHITLIQDLYNSQQYSTANKYVGDFLENLYRNNNANFHSKNYILEVFINNKISFARKKRIEFNAFDNSSGMLFISNIDIVTLFSNLIDNAIESACLENNGKINLAIEDYEKSTLITIQNTYSKVIFNNNGEYQTTKKNHVGLGLSILSKTVNKYCGIISISHDSEVFTIIIIFPSKDIAYNY